MKTLLILFVTFLLFNRLSALEVDTNTSCVSLLAKSRIFFDSNATYSLHRPDTKLFTPNTTDTLTYGFVPNGTLWIEIRLKNTTGESLRKIIAYEDAVTELLTFYDASQTLYDGMWRVAKERNSIYPAFSVTLQPFEEKTLYIQANSKISTLIAKVTLYNPTDFLVKDFDRKLVVFIFLTILLTLLLYNFMLYLFTKQKAYLYYVFYMFSLIFFQSYYLGVSQLYIFSHAMSVIVAKASLIYISVFILSILLFTREFLGTYRFKKIDAIFRFYLYATPPLALLGYNNFLFDLNAIVFFIPLGALIIFTGFYALFQGVKEARYYIVGWSFIALSLVFTNLKTLGIFDIDLYFAYSNEVAFTLEAFLFSIALAHKIKILTQEKNEADRVLNESLNTLVDEKTKELHAALEGQKLLYKELNHRVKNNLQMIASLIKLQKSSSKQSETQNALQTTYNRVLSISELYDILRIEKLHDTSDVTEYFSLICSNIASNFTKDVTFNYDIQALVTIQELLYCGLILNELVTNACKHAFDDRGTIDISLHHEQNRFVLTIHDNGEAKEENFTTTNSLGLTIVKTLVAKQLFGTMHTTFHAGTTFIIEWSENGK